MGSVIGPAPGTVINRRHGARALASAWTGKSSRVICYERPALEPDGGRNMPKSRANGVDIHYQAAGVGSGDYP